MKRSIPNQYEHLESFLLSLEDFRLTGGSKPDFDDIVVKTIEKMLSLRDDFAEFTKTIFRHNEEVDLDNLYTFFEKLINFKYKPESVKQWNRMDFDNYKFFIYELFLYFITVLFQLKKYKEASFFINSQYFFRDNYGELAHSGISIFNDHVASLDETRNKRLDLRRVSVTADLIKQRVNRKDIRFKQLVETDLILHYITELRANKRTGSWFPRCSVYAPGRITQIELFSRMISRKQFDKIKILFEVNNVDDLKRLISEYVKRFEGKPRRYPNHNIMPIEEVINLEEIGTII